MSQRVTVFGIEGGYSQRKSELPHRIQIQARNLKTRCGRCGRGIVFLWPMGKEPEVRDCKICGARTDIHIRGWLSAGRAGR